MKVSILNPSSGGFELPTGCTFSDTELSLFSGKIVLRADNGSGAPDLRVISSETNYMLIQADALQMHLPGSYSGMTGDGRFVVEGQYVLAAPIAGWAWGTYSAVAGELDPSTATASNCAEAINALSRDLNSHGLLKVS